MSQAGEAQPPDPQPCVVCGVNVVGTPHLGLALFGVFSEQDDGMFFEPEEDPSSTLESWRDVPLSRFVHLTCTQAYFEALLAEAAFFRRKEAAEGEQP